MTDKAKQGPPNCPHAQGQEGHYPPSLRRPASYRDLRGLRSLWDPPPNGKETATGL